MKAVVQRVTQACVTINGSRVGEIKSGLLVFLGIGHGDTEDDVDLLVRKLPRFRIFRDNEEKMNRSVLDIGGSILVVSQFTLYGTWRRGNRPGFSHAADPGKAETLYNSFVIKLSKTGVPVETGEFGAMMHVASQNDGPVTFIMDTREE